jgi:hypothetical protein
MNFYFQHEPNFGTIEDHDCPGCGPDPKPASGLKHTEMLGCTNTAMTFSGHEHQYTRGEITRGFWKSKAGSDPSCTTAFKTFHEVKAASSGAPWYEDEVSPRSAHLKKVVSRLSSPWIYDDTHLHKPYHYAIVTVVGDEVGLEVVAWNKRSATPGDGEEVTINPALIVRKGSGGSGSISQSLDIDLDGAVNSEEQTGDADGDGVTDDRDPDTARVATAYSGMQVTTDLHEGPRAVVLPQPPILSNVETLLDSNSSIDQAGKPDKEFIAGLFAGDVRVPRGGTATVTLSFPFDVSTDSQYFSVGDDWQPIPLDSNDGDRKVAVTLVDGGAGDLDRDANGTIVYRGGLGIPAQAVVNSLVTLAPQWSSVTHVQDTTGCVSMVEGRTVAPRFVGTYSFDALLTNQSDRRLSDVAIEVVTLTNANLLRNADPSPARPSRLTIPRADDYQDGTLGPGESVMVSFSVCLTRQRPFQFFVNVRGRQLGGVN